MAAFNGIAPNLAEEGKVAKRLQGLAVTADFFPALGVQPQLGRVLTAAEDQPGANLVVVLSDRFWQRRFGGDPTIIGRKVRLDGESVEVIGVMIVASTSAACRLVRKPVNARLGPDQEVAHHDYLFLEAPPCPPV